jgi:hypothetical protein
MFSPSIPIHVFEKSKPHGSALWIEDLLDEHVMPVVVLVEV